MNKKHRLDVEGLFSQLAFGNGYMHYGYWGEGDALEMTLACLNQAQKRYMDRLAEQIPKGVKSILDVGSGTGGNAETLIEKGYKVDCLSPSLALNAIAREKLGDRAQVFEGLFEDFALEKKYDLLLFSESFHYMNPVQALEKAVQLAPGHLLIFDYFRKQDWRGNSFSYNQLMQLLQDDFGNRFTLHHNEDLTPHILPTFKIIEELSNRYTRPFLKAKVEDFRINHPFVYWPLYPFFRKIRNYSEKKSRKYHYYARNHEYRMLILERTG